MDLNDVLINLDMTQQEYEYMVKCSKRFINNLCDKTGYNCYLNNEDKEDLVNLSYTKFIQTFDIEKGYKPSTYYYNILFNNYRNQNKKCSADLEYVGFNADDVEKIIESKSYSFAKKSQKVDKKDL